MILNNKLKSLIKIKIKSSKIKKINKSKLFKKYEGEVKTDKPNGLGSMVLNDNSVIYGDFKNGKLNGFGIRENKGKTSEIGFFKNSQLLGETLKIYMSRKDKNLNYETYVGEQKDSGYAHGRGTSIFMEYFVCAGSWNYGFAHGECIINLYGKGVIRGIWKYGKLTKVLNKFGNTSYISLFSILSNNMEWDESIDTQKKVIAVIKDISN